MYYRSEMVDLARSWVGKNENDGSYKEIIDIYNSQKNLPRGTKMQYDWAWCAATWSALAIKLGYGDIIPIEMSCYYLIDKAIKMGCWQENDGYIPKPGDAVLYDWNDKGIGDNKGNPDHIGIVEYVNTASGYFVVIEGNYKDSVKKRTVSINGKFIRGFITPKYDCDIVDLPDGTNKTVKELAMEVISGLWGNGDARKEALESYGYDYEEIRKEVNLILNTTKEPEKGTVKVEATCKAMSFNTSFSGVYKTSANVHCRNDAGTNKKSLVLIPKGTEVRNYGYYTLFNGSKWLLIQFILNGISYTGFTHEAYLKKV